MQNTDNFGLHIYEGSDIFNPLTVENENMETIDEQMFLNSIATVSQAVEIKSGTVHALTRENPDAAMFRFVATSKFDVGDTFTVDGIQVTGLTTDGKTLADGAYVINANVLCCLTGTVLTLFVAAGEIATAENAFKLGGQLPEYYGTASDVQTAITTAQAAGVLATSASETATEIKDTLYKWTKITTVSGTNNIQLPATFNELLLDCLNDGAHYTSVIPYEMLNATDINIIIGGYFAFGGYGASCSGVVSRTNARLTECYKNTNNIVNSCSLTAYYR